MTRRGRSTSALAAGSALSGLLAYVVFALTTRGLGAEAAAPVTVLWSYWAMAGAAFTFPIQHWITRAATAHGEAAVRRSLPRLLLGVLGMSLLAGALAALGREHLFDRDDLWFPTMVVLVSLGSAASGVVRGVLSARRRFVAVGALLVVENAIRCVVVGVLFAAGSSNVTAYGFALVAGYGMAVLSPSSLRLSADDTHEQPRRPTGVLTFLAGAGAGQLVSQAVLTGGPVALALIAGSEREVTALFAALALYRAPYILALGVVPALTGRVTSMLLRGEAHGVLRLTWISVAATAATALVALAGAAALGPDVLRLVFGEEVVLGRLHSALTAAGCAVAIGNLVLMVVALARDRPVRVVRAWSVAGAAGIAILVALTELDPLDRAVCAFVVAEGIAFAGLVAVSVRRSTRPTGGRGR